MLILQFDNEKHTLPEAICQKSNSTAEAYFRIAAMECLGPMKFPNLQEWKNHIQDQCDELLHLMFAQSCLLTNKANNGD